MNKNTPLKSGLSPGLVLNQKAYHTAVCGKGADNLPVMLLARPPEICLIFEDQSAVSRVRLVMMALCPKRRGLLQHSVPTAGFRLVWHDTHQGLQIKQNSCTETPMCRARHQPPCRMKLPLSRTAFVIHLFNHKLWGVLLSTVTVLENNFVVFHFITSIFDFFPTT